MGTRTGWGFSCELARAYREEAGLTVPEAAERVGRTQSWLLMLEAGDRQPGEGDVEALARALCVEPSDLEWA